MPEPHVSSLDRGFLLGDALFETLRLYGGRPFRLGDHLSRLEAGAARLGIPVPSDLAARVEETLAGAPDADGALRITLSRGIGGGLAPPDSPSPTLILHRFDWRPDPEWYRTGLAAVVAGRVDERALTAGLKSTNYMERIQALRVAHSRGAREALLSNGRGLVVEGSASNLLVWRDGAVFAPGPKEGALPGITREVVLELLSEGSAQVEERGLPEEAVRGADEVILTSTLRELVPIVTVDGHPIGAGAPGRAFTSLREQFRERVAKELG